MKTVSVIVPCYNAAKYLDKCIQHLLHQTIGIENIEIILVNDASTDEGKTWKIITEYERNFPDTIIAITLEENLRQGGARNVGISYASGEYLIFCDADDWLLEETLEHCYCAAREQDADIVEFLINNVRDHEITVPLIKGNRDLLIETDTEEKKIAFLMTSCVEFSYGSQKKFYKRALIQDHNIRFAEHLIFEEPSFMVPIRFYEKRHYFLDEMLYVCYLSPDSTVRSDWAELHKWDNPKVWMTLMEDLDRRGLFQRYYGELEYLFFGWGLGLSIKMAIQKGYMLTKEEMEFLVNMTLRLFPNIKQNKYVRADVAESTWNKLIVTILDLEFTDESIQAINRILKKYI